MIWRLRNANAGEVVVKIVSPIELPNTKIAADNLSGHRAVLLNDAGQLEYASNTDPQHGFKILGIIRGAVMVGEPTPISVAGEVSEPSWNWTLNLPIWLGTDGLITQVVPEVSLGAAVRVKVAYPITPQSIYWRVSSPTLLV